MAHAYTQDTSRTAVSINSAVHQLGHQEALCAAVIHTFPQPSPTVEPGHTSTKYTLSKTVMKMIMLTKFVIMMIIHL